MPEPFNPQALNRYSYTLNNPINYIDPSGFWAYIPHGNAARFYGDENRNGSRIIDLGGGYSKYFYPGLYFRDEAVPIVTHYQDKEETWYGVIQGRSTV